MSSFRALKSRQNVLLLKAAPTATAVVSVVYMSVKTNHSRSTLYGRSVGWLTCSLERGTSDKIEKHIK